MNDWLSTPPFDLHSLELFRLVAESGSFTRAGERAGLTQSAVTRQIQRMEERLGVRLFERTTRTVRMTEAGDFLLKESRRWLQGIDQSVLEFREKFVGAPRRIRVGVAQSIGFSCLPGFFTNYQRANPDDLIDVNYDNSETILEKVGGGDCDVGVCSARTRLSRALEVTHRFDDQFELIVPPWRRGGSDGEDPFGRLMNTATKSWAATQRALAGVRMVQFSSSGETDAMLGNWLRKRAGDPPVAMQAGSFDLVINLVSMGFGWSLVPQRSLAIYGRRKPVRRLRFPKASGRRRRSLMPTREIIVVVRRDNARPEHLSEFIQRILF